MTARCKKVDDEGMSAENELNVLFPKRIEDLFPCRCRCDSIWLNKVVRNNVRSTTNFTETDERRYEMCAFVINEAAIYVPARTRRMLVAVGNNVSMNEVVCVENHDMRWLQFPCRCEPKSNLESLIGASTIEKVVCIDGKLGRQEITDALVRMRVGRNLIANHNH